MIRRIDYYYLPKKNHKKHDYCEFVISQIEELVISEEFKSLKQQEIPLNELLLNRLNSVDKDKNILDFFEQNNLIDELNHVVRNRLLLSLIMETCYFIQECLFCSLKMRMTVCFTLMRKPFLEVAIILMRILSEEDFIDRFNNEEKFDSVKTTPEQKKELIRQTNIHLKEKYHVEDIYDFIFNKDYPDSLYNVSNSAIHLFTDRTENKTGKQNLNFIFSTQQDNLRYWDYIYETVPMILTFLADLIDLLVLKSTSCDRVLIMDRVKAREKMKNKKNVC